VKFQSNSKKWSTNELTTNRKEKGRLVGVYEGEQVGNISPGDNGVIKYGCCRRFYVVDFECTSGAQLREEIALSMDPGKKCTAEDVFSSEKVRATPAH